MNVGKGKFTVTYYFESFFPGNENSNDSYDQPLDADAKLLAKALQVMGSLPTRNAHLYELQIIVKFVYRAFYALLHF